MTQLCVLYELIYSILFSIIFVYILCSYLLFTYYYIYLWASDMMCWLSNKLDNDGKLKL